MIVHVIKNQRLSAIVCGLWILSITACSSQQQSDEDLQASEEGGNEISQNVGQDDAAEGNGQENFVDGEEGAAPQNADTNSDTATADAGLDEGATNLAPPVGNDPGLTNAPVANAAAPMNQAPAQAPINQAPVNAAAAPAAAPAPASDTAPIPGGRVRYVPQGGIQVVNAPNGSAVTTLEQGEHPITWEEGGWLKLANGMYVQAGSLSDSGVPRPNSSTAQPWQH